MRSRIRLIIIALICAVFVVFSLGNITVMRFEYTPSSAAFMNPYMGYMPWAANYRPEYNLDINFTLAFAILKWSDFEPSEGVYDFESFEKFHNLEYLSGQGVRLVIRFVCDYPSTDPSAGTHIDIPQWLYEQSGGAGEFYDKHGSRGFAPDYSNQLIMERHKLAIEALAGRYDASGEIAFIQLGSLGHWGEWHEIYTADGVFTDPETYSVYIGHYTGAFTATKMMMRRPFGTAASGVGFYNDMIGRADSTDMWLGWIKEAGLGEFYKYSPSGGEFSSHYPMESYFGSMYDEVKRMVVGSHTTYIGCPQPEGDLAEEAVDLLGVIGYRFTVESAMLIGKLKNNSNLRLEADIKNTGIAPFYYDWYFCLLVFDETGRQVDFHNPSWNARSIMPGETITFKTGISLRSGTYTIKIGLFEPGKTIPGARLANEGAGGDLLLTIAEIVVK